MGGRELAKLPRGTLVLAVPTLFPGREVQGKLRSVVIVGPDDFGVVLDGDPRHLRSPLYEFYAEKPSIAHMYKTLIRFGIAIAIFVGLLVAGIAIAIATKGTP
jgi:hypothetical protein